MYLEGRESRVVKVAGKRRDRRFLFCWLILAIWVGTPGLVLGTGGPGVQGVQPLGAVVRNPFQPPPVVTRKLQQANRAKTHVPQTPLEKYDLESFVLTGIVADMAMVVSPDGSTYIIKKGTRIGKRGGVVVGVYGDRVAVKREDKIVYLTFPKD